MKKTSICLILVAAAAAVPAHADWPTLDQRVKNPWLFSFGSFSGGQELGSAFAPVPTSQIDCNGSRMYQPDLAFLEALGIEVGVGYEVATHPVDLRFTERYQTFGWTNDYSQGGPRSILGVDALFRYDMVYFGPGAGLGYVSAPNGFTFQGAPKQVLSAVVGCDVSRSVFAEARLQTSSSEQFRAASVSFGLRF